MLKDALPHAGLGPAAEPAVRVLPIARALGQIAPRNSDAVSIHNPFDERAIITRGDADVPGLGRRFCLAAPQLAAVHLDLSRGELHCAEVSQTRRRLLPESPDALFMPPSHRARCWVPVDYVA
jgi:hypothetical protein